MTDKQKFKLYFPLWRQACEANGWERAESRRQRVGNETGSEWVSKVETFARQLAKSRDQGAAEQGVTVDDLRHGAHICALGRDKSSKDFTNGDLDRVVSLFRLLIEPTDLDASMNLADPERGQAARIKHFIKHAAPFAYTDAICRGKFRGSYESPFWEDLPMWALKDLARTLAERKKAWSSTAKNAENAKRPEREMAGMEQPF